ncbi:MAG TPA: hypothetical protein PL063_08765 [Candidatus Cloacimonadota bacterium]|jgi:predicted ATP-grasp superfamily ATP-dependent carboligase|nr:hypothetical protein [Candidatus Cloacimonadales bacterium]HPY97292.1 hypothetical protein [Candidatus Cloacimonadota bacterium]HQB41821.1 hypothetical protein [Candidatus Cloacimonadota bacterium]
MMKNKAIVIGSYGRATLSIIRLLGEKKVSVYFLSNKRENSRAIQKSKYIVKSWAFDDDYDHDEMLKVLLDNF